MPKVITRTQHATPPAASKPSRAAPKRVAGHQLVLPVELPPEQPFCFSCKTPMQRDSLLGDGQWRCSRCGRGVQEDPLFGYLPVESTRIRIQEERKQLRLVRERLVRQSERIAETIRSLERWARGSSRGLDETSQSQLTRLRADQEECRRAIQEYSLRLEKLARKR